jgi:hypothetical protein
MNRNSVQWKCVQGGVLLLFLPALSLGCEKITGILGRAPLPDFGPPIPVSVRMEFDSSLSDASAQYLDSCNHPREVRIGPVLEDTLLQAAYQTFKTVSFAGSGPAQTKPDVEVRLTLLKPRFNIKNDNVYDREPARLALDAVATFRDSSGKLLREQPLQVSRQERLLVEPTQQRCAYASLDKFVSDTAVVLSSKFIREARALLAPETVTASAGEAPAPQASPSMPAGQVVSFKATILDENGNLILEGGERVRLRVEVVNTGTHPAQGVSVTLGGTPAVVTQFPATTLPVGALQPGESRSVEFAATLPQSVQAQRAELLVSITEASGGAAPAAQTIVAAMRPGGQEAGGGFVAGRYDDVDQVPAASADFQRPHAFLIAVGIGAYRDERNHTRKYAARDAGLVAAYFQTLGGVPTANALVLQDRKALRPGIEEALLDWLPPRVKSESVVIVYFAGQAVVSPSGETYLVPYEGSRNSVSRLYPLDDLHAALSKLHAQLTLLIFDGSVSQVGKDARAKAKPPRWDVGGGGVGGGGTIVHLIGTTGLHDALESDKLRHGLFTYYLLRGLRGEADANHDGEVTLGELTAFLGESVPAAARSDFRQEQHPLVFPAMSSTSKLAGFTLTKPSASHARQNR